MPAPAGLALKRQVSLAGVPTAKEGATREGATREGAAREGAAKENPKEPSREALKDGARNGVNPAGLVTAPAPVLKRQVTSSPGLAAAEGASAGEAASHMAPALKRTGEFSRPPPLVAPAGAPPVPTPSEAPRLSRLDGDLDAPTMVGPPTQEAPPRRPAREPAPLLLIEPSTNPRNTSVSFIPAPRSRYFKLWVGGAVGVVLLGLVGVGVFVGQDGGRDKVQISNLGADETLYVAGVKVDPLNLRFTTTQPLIVATARGGHLRRLGRVTPGAELDVKALIEVSEAGTSAQTAPLSISSEPSGCAVSVDGKAFPERSPTQLTVEAGRELRVEITCPGRSPFHRSVLAAPGQAVDLRVGGADT